MGLLSYLRRDDLLEDKREELPAPSDGQRRMERVVLEGRQVCSPPPISSTNCRRSPQQGTIGPRERLHNGIHAKPPGPGFATPVLVLLTPSQRCPRRPTTPTIRESD
jgi:hypothetical protein